MAWRPSAFLIEGELDNTVPGKVTGHMTFKGMVGRVTFNLKGDFHRDIRGTKIRLQGRPQEDKDLGDRTESAKEYMTGFRKRQTGKVGDITAGLPPQDYAKYPYIEWYSDGNGRCCVELEPTQVEVIGTPIPACESDPVSRAEQKANMDGFMQMMGEALMNQSKKPKRSRKPRKPASQVSKPQRLTQPRAGVRLVPAWMLN